MSLFPLAPLVIQSNAAARPASTRPIGHRRLPTFEPSTSHLPSASIPSIRPCSTMSVPCPICLRYQLRLPPLHLAAICWVKPNHCLSRTACLQCSSPAVARDERTEVASRLSLMAGADTFTCKGVGGALSCRCLYRMGMPKRSDGQVPGWALQASSVRVSPCC